MTGDDLRRAIERATPLVNPRLSEVEWDDVAALLADTPSVEPAGLDVERLMFAIHRSGVAGCPEDCTSALDEYPSGADSDYATFLAREYAALLPTQASDSPEPKETR